MVWKLSMATENMVTRVTAITSPMVLRELRSGYRTAFCAASRAGAVRPKIRPTNRRVGGITR